MAGDLTDVGSQSPPARSGREASPCPREETAPHLSAASLSLSPVRSHDRSEETPEQRLWREHRQEVRETTRLQLRAREEARAPASRTSRPRDADGPEATSWLLQLTGSRDRSRREPAAEGGAWEKPQPQPGIRWGRRWNCLLP